MLFKRKKDLDYYKKRGLSIGENVECYSIDGIDSLFPWLITCLLYTSPSPRDTR